MGIWPWTWGKKEEDEEEKESAHERVEGASYTKISGELIKMMNKLDNMKSRLRRSPGDRVKADIGELRRKFEELRVESVHTILLDGPQRKTLKKLFAGVQAQLDDAEKKVAA